jgi:hypothetical protein
VVTWPRRIALVVLGGGVLAVVGAAVIARLSRIDPPPAEPSLEAPLAVRGARCYVGPDWIGRERGVWELHLEGDPYAIGYAHARLGTRLLVETEDYLFAEMGRYVRSPLALLLLRLGVGWHYRHLAEDIPRERLRELGAMSRGYLADEHRDFLPLFQRIVYYHALHDITQRLERSPLLGCTAFAASGAATRDGHLYVGRNFDFEGPEPFDRDKAVLFFKPAGRIPFASVAWAGMAGAVTGLNAEHLYVSINAARTDEPGGPGIPVELLLREVLESARSIDEAVAIVGAHPVMVPDFYLVADGKTGESAVIERSPHRIAVRRSRDLTLLTNHALTAVFAGDREDARLRDGLTSGARYARLEELSRARFGAFDPATVVATLRDKRGVGGTPLGLGNRNAIDALIATHSVVVDATDLILWVSTGPHLVGRYVGFDLRRELRGQQRPQPPDLPPDPIAADPALALHEQAMAELQLAERLASRASAADRRAALEVARRAEGLEEDLPEPHKLVADLLWSSDPERAAAEYRRFLALHPPYRRDVEEAERRLGAR